MPTHDALNNLSSEQRTGACAYSRSYTLDAAGNRTIAGYSYGAANKLTGTGFQYDSDGNTTSTGIVAGNDYYNSLNQMTSHTDATGPSSQFTSDGFGRRVVNVFDPYGANIKYFTLRLRLST